MPIEAHTAAAAAPTRPALRLNYQRLVNAIFALFIFCGAIAFVEPSPYDFVSLIAMPMWFVGGFRVHRGVIPFVVLIILYNVAGFISLVPYWNEPDPRAFMLQSLYLAITAIFFVIFFNERTEERIALCLKAFAASTVFGALTGIIGYFDIAGTGEIFATYGRSAGTFKDPNVFGSYLILGALYLLQAVMLSRGKSLVLVFLLFLIDILGIFLSFSRGSEGAFLIAVTTMVGLTFITTQQRSMRRRIVVGTLCAIVAGVLILVAILSVDSIRELFLQRLQAPGEEYDDPRFFNQLHSLPLLLDRPNGFGPLRFRLWFFLEPHSSYVNAFASYGWLGGFVFLTMVAATTFVGFRLTLTRSPFQTPALVVWPALMIFFLQGFQIDIDHWRHVYLMLGMVWGLEAARLRWSQGRRAPAVANATARQPASAHTPAISFSRKM
ncbi:MAG TPA: hypothetical protein VG271_01040 [Beijerinckiaceae bacterium]|nr:hypothetical protein [Beijerinckiaceae bacterium]